MQKHKLISVFSHVCPIWDRSLGFGNCNAVDKKINTTGSVLILEIVIAFF